MSQKWMRPVLFSSSKVKAQKRPSCVSEGCGLRALATLRGVATEPTILPVATPSCS